MPDTETLAESLLLLQLRTPTKLIAHTNTKGINIVGPTRFCNLGCLEKEQKKADLYFIYTHTPLFVWMNM